MGQVVTFYSYKGGVGRTMSLANTAVLLCQWGYKTLMVDWDLEAPGLEFFFKNHLDPKKAREQEGLADLLYKASESKLSTEAPLDWQHSLLNIELPDQEAALHLLAAGKRDDEYFSRVRALDMKSFYENNGGYFIERLRNDWKETYDYILVDSRTGITDIGGVSTIQMPDLLVALFTTTDQGLNGVIDVFQKANLARRKLPVDRTTLRTLPIPSRFDTGKEFRISQQWLDRFASELGGFYANWLPTAVNKRDFLSITKIPYGAYFSFGEKLPVLEEGTVDPAGLGHAYENLAALLAHNLEHADLLLSSRDQFIKAAVKGASREELPRNDAALGTDSQPKHGPRIYLSYAREDREKVRELYQRLAGVGFTPWMDEMDLLPGEKWEPAIARAIERADFLLVCLSANSAQRTHRKEVLSALQFWKTRFQGSLWLIPVRLEGAEGEVPEELRELQWIDLFEKEGEERLLQTLREGMKRRERYKALILTSRQSVSAAVRESLFDLQEKTLPDGTLNETGQFNAHEKRWKVSLYEIDAQNPHLISELTTLIQKLEPNLVLSLGLARGNDQTAAGDVVVATEIGSLEDVEVPIANLWHSSPSLVRRLRNVARNPSWLDRIETSEIKPRVLTGKLVLEAVLPMHEFAQFDSDTLAFETIQEQSLVIRGIPNPPNETEPFDEIREAAAARHACAFAFELLAKLERADLANGS
jgi:cellulose biosynthesis protein BcsQ